jgi:segregation and condensation protein B
MSENQEPAFAPESLAEVEALLFATDAPLGADRIAALTALKDRKEVKAAITSLREGYDADARAFTIVEFGGGYSVSTRPEHANLVKKLFKGRRKQRLTRASLEALAIIAYKQPVTRIEIEEIRGVAASGVLGTLLERDLIHIVGRAESLGHPLLYGTTRAFLDYVGLAHVRELPQLSELEDLLAEREDLKQLASSRGEDLGEEDFDRALAPEDEEAADEELEDGDSVGEEAAAEETVAEEEASEEVDGEGPGDEVAELDEDEDPKHGVSDEAEASA